MKKEILHNSLPDPDNGHDFTPLPLRARHDGGAGFKAPLPRDAAMECPRRLDPSGPEGRTSDVDQIGDAPIQAREPDGDEYAPVTLRVRHDGWTPERQKDFLVALSECACVDEACKRVGMSVSGAYALRRRPDAQNFRRAWDSALDYGVRRLSDAAFSRALHGVTRPVFYQGEQVGTRTYYDERLTMFILRYRDPLRYGKWLDTMSFTQPEDGAAGLAEKLAERAECDALADEAGLDRVPWNDLPTRLQPDLPLPPKGGGKA